MRRALAIAVFAVTLAGAPAAFADCVDYSPARAERAAAALSRNAPTAATLGMPTLDGLALDALRTTGDPQCNGPPKQFYYTTDMTLLAFVNALYPNIRKRTEADGMGRLWYKNPFHGNSLFLTSGTEVTIQTRGEGGPITLIGLKPGNPVLPLASETQPYSAQDIANWTPWPGGPNGRREFVRADGGAVAPPPGQQSAQSAPQAQTPACPPAGQGAATGAQAGAAVGGAAIGGGYGRALGSAAGAALGGMLGSRRGQQQPAATTPDCR